MHELLLSLRRDFHAWPEIAWSEFQTTAKIADFLSPLNCKVLLGKDAIDLKTALGREEEQITAEFKNALERAKAASPELLPYLQQMDAISGAAAIFNEGKSPVIALRFDIDCVGVDESQDPSHKPCQLGFSSKRKNLMHACGHDAHTAIGLALAAWLHENPINACVKLLFQPAEEGCKGAAGMLHLLHDVDFLLSFHIGVLARSHEVVSSPSGFLCTSKIDFYFTGKAAHAGKDPEAGANALLACANAASSLFGISRHGQGKSRVNVGFMQAGEGRNVIAQKAYMQAEVRGENEEINSYMSKRAIEIAQGCALAQGCEVEHKIVGHSIDVRNDEYLSALVSKKAQEQGFLVIENGDMGASDDASLLIKAVQERGKQGIYFILGSNLTAGHHQADFDIDEAVLEPGLELLKALLQELASR